MAQIKRCRWRCVRYFFALGGRARDVAPTGNAGSVKRSNAVTVAGVWLESVVDSTGGVGAQGRNPLPAAVVYCTVDMKTVFVVGVVAPADFDTVGGQCGGLK